MVRILHADWSISLRENRPDQNSKTFGGYAVMRNKYTNMGHRINFHAFFL